jgi:hypothetical protein
MLQPQEQENGRGAPSGDGCACSWRGHWPARPSSLIPLATKPSFSSAQGDLVRSRTSYRESYCLASCTCEPEGLAGRLGQKRKEQVHETMG